MTLGLLLDLIIILLLGATIFYAARLSVHLKTFRQGRKDLERLIQELSGAIMRAEGALSGLKDTARGEGAELQKVVNDARTCIDELEIITQAGDSMANRLEGIASRNREIADTMKGQDTRPSFGVDKSNDKDADRIADDIFNIRDAEFDADETNEWDGAEDLQSEAEKELFKALKKGGM